MKEASQSNDEKEGPRNKSVGIEDTGIYIRTDSIRIRPVRIGPVQMGSTQYKPLVDLRDEAI